jgi:phage tail sheath protein FI
MAAAGTSEPSLFALPDLPASLADDDQRRDVLAGASRLFTETLDRLLIADLPETIDSAPAADDWIAAFGDVETLLRTTAAYHPWIAVNDPLAPPSAPPRHLPPSGHVAGVISRLDRERGAMTTPANAALEGAIDLARTLEQPAQAGLYALGINPVVCQSGRGLVVWGGRTLGGGDPLRVGASFVEHRRLIHRLVRAIRQTARPLVFETNGPVLWYALARGATTILLEAWRARALKGVRPEEAFRVRCDATLNTPEMIERGQVVCEISLAPAVPMEFITIRVALSGDGKLEVAEQ